jgi:tetracycline 7-halogenase / FADH2 O2-dependent halogenase
VPAEVVDFVVIGSGFGGSIMSMVLRRRGHTVAMVEQGRHPRFAIGESSTPFANLLLEQLAHDYDLPFLKNLSEWGLWQTHFPELPVGLKRGFTFFHHASGECLDLRKRSSQLLVAASPNNRVADTHWYRPDFDHFLLRKAVELGVVYSDETSIESIVQDGTGWKAIASSPSGSRIISAAFIIDASGFSGVFSKYLSLPTQPLPHMPSTSGVWAHFRDVPRLEETFSELGNFETPYPPDDAAVHHVFPGGWVWVLKFNNGITSAGAAFSADAGVTETEPVQIWNQILEKIPPLAEQFRKARAVTPFYHSRQLSFLRPEIAGSNWALLPSTAGFVDPLLSTGFALNLLGIKRLVRAVSSGTLDDYAKKTRSELEAAADLVSALYAKMNNFDQFALLTLLYFAAMSFTESAWRLDNKRLASGFLLTNDKIFSRSRAELCAAARSGQTVTRAQIETAITHYDVAGLTDWRRNNHYPVEFCDLISNAHKLSVDAVQVDALLRKLSQQRRYSGT